MASGALPPGFPAIEIEGEHYWDGGLVSNTPLQWIAMTQQRPPDTLAFQVDLWSARGDFPRNLAEVATRQKEIHSPAEPAPSPTTSSMWQSCGTCSRRSSRNCRRKCGSAKK